jgi:hypothetical protein
MFVVLAEINARAMPKSVAHKDGCWNLTPRT